MKRSTIILALLIPGGIVALLGFEAYRRWRRRQMRAMKQEGGKVIPFVPRQSSWWGRS